jgi:hypothetical protein
MGSPQGEQQEQVQEDQQEVTAEELSQQEADESAGFAASFGEQARGDEPPAEEQNEPEEQEAGEAQEEAVAEQAADEAGGEADSRVAGVTEEQLTAMLAKLPKIEELETMTTAEIRKLHGKFGDINRTLQELQKGNAAKPGVRLAAAKLTRLQENFPELAEMLAEDLNDSAELGGSPSVDVEALVNQQVDEKVKAAREEMEQRMQMNLLKIQHRDCFEIPKSDEWKVWLQTLPADEQEKIGDSWDADYLGSKLTEFKSWRDTKHQGSQQRKARLERAITPKGVAQAVKPAVMTEEDGFAAAFKR